LSPFRLRFLQLDDTAIEGPGLEKLDGLKNLTQLLLNGTQVTDAGVTRLQTALPGCLISRDKAASEANGLRGNVP